MGEHTAYRLGGLALILLSVAFGWWGIWQPYHAALAHDPQVSYHVRIFVLVPLAFVFGAFFLLFGNTIPYRDAVQRKFTTAGWVLMVVVTCVSGVAFFGLTRMFGELGYR
jgi:hypothetical protein